MTMKPDDDKCWICLSSEDGGDWRKVCKCNLWAHEACILQWDRIQDEGSTRCPQCRAPIHIEGTRSTLLDIDTILHNFSFSVLGGAAVSVATRIILSDVVYQALYEHGATSVRLMCSSKLAATILGPLWTVHRRMTPLNPGFFHTAPHLVRPSLSQLIRSTLLPIIPLWLCNSSPFLNMAALGLGIVCLHTPMVGPLKAAIAVVAAKPIYRAVYNRLSARYLQSLAQQVFEQTQADEYTAAVQQLELIIDEAIDERGMPVEIPIEEQAEQAGQFMQALGDVVAIQNQRNGDFLRGETSPFIDVVNALATPLYSSLVGKVLGMIPALGGIDVFYRNLASMCLLVVGRDLWRLLLASRRARLETRRRVLNYGESSAFDRPLVLQWLLNMSNPLVHLRHLINIDVRFA